MSRYDEWDDGQSDTYWTGCCNVDVTEQIEHWTESTTVMCPECSEWAVVERQEADPFIDLARNGGDGDDD